MELLATLRTLRRHWVLILALTVAAGLLGAASAELSKGTTKSRAYYKATTTLVVDLTQRTGESTSAFQSLDQVAIFTTTGQVPDQVAKKLGSDQNGGQLAEHITAFSLGGIDAIRKAPAKRRRKAS